MKTVKRKRRQAINWEKIMFLTKGLFADYIRTLKTQP